MRNKLKKTLVSLLAAGTIGLGTIGVSPAKAESLKLKPYAYFELAYVPRRTFFKRYRNEYMSKLGLGLNFDLKKFDFTVNVEQTTYAHPVKNRTMSFHPNTQVYDYTMELRRKFKSSSLSLFFSHECTHPVDDNPFWIKDFRMNYTDLTKIGIRFDFGRRKN